MGVTCILPFQLNIEVGVVEVVVVVMVAMVVANPARALLILGHSSSSFSSSSYHHHHHHRVWVRTYTLLVRCTTSISIPNIACSGEGKNLCHALSSCIILVRSSSGGGCGGCGGGTSFDLLKTPIF